MKVETLVERESQSMFPVAATIRDIKAEAYGISTLYLTAPGIVEQGFKPGQFNMLHLPGFGEVAISISSDPADRTMLGHTIRLAGTVTRAIGQLKVGSQIGLRGPYGNGWPLEEAKGKDLLIVGGGIGLAPLRPLLHHVARNRQQFGRVILLYGGRTPTDLLYEYEFPAWREAGVEIHVSVDRADESWNGSVGVIPITFYRIRIEHRNTLVFTCGPEIMMRFVIFEALARRIPKESIYLSMERNMKCGYGVCGHCQIGPYFICKNGPILKYSEIEPYFGKENF